MTQILDTDYVGDSLDKLLLNSNTTVNLTLKAKREKT